MADFEYFRAEESDQFSFFRIPKALFTEKEFASLSTDAKLLSVYMKSSGKEYQNHFATMERRY